MTEYSIREAAALLGVSDDTIRRWGESGRLVVRSPSRGRQTVDGIDLARVAEEIALEARRDLEFPTASTSARNRFTGIVTRIQRDGVMAQVDIQAGPFRVVSLLSREAADDLQLEVGMPATGVVKATSVSIQIPQVHS